MQTSLRRCPRVISHPSVENHLRGWTPHPRSLRLVHAQDGSMDIAPRTTPTGIRVLGKLRTIISKPLWRPQPSENKRKRTKGPETNYDRVPVYSPIHTNYVLHGMERR